MQRGTNLLLDRDKDCGYPEAQKRYGEYTGIVVSYTSKRYLEAVKELGEMLNSFGEKNIPELQKAPSP